MMDYIRLVYGVPAKRGGKVKYGNRFGVITGADGGYILVRLNGDKKSKRYHPVWNMEYLNSGDDHAN